MQQPTKTMYVAWSKIGDGTPRATAGSPGKGQIRLRVEGLPDGSWEWTTWSAIRPGKFRSGSLCNQEAACAAAERAALEMGAISQLPDVQRE